MSEGRRTGGHPRGGNALDDGKTELVLVADGNRGVRASARAALEALGFAVAEAADGDEALRVCLRDRPALVLLNVRMPGRDGVAVCETLRGERGEVDLPIVLMAGPEDSVALDRAFDAGATDFVTKPVPWNALAHRVRHLLRGSRAVADLRRSRASLTRAHELAGVASVEIDLASGELKASDTLRALAGFAESEAITLPALMGRIHSDDRAPFSNGLRMAREGQLAFPERFRIDVVGIGERVFQTATGLIVGSDGLPSFLDLAMQDVTDAQATHQQVRFMAYHDPLTGLGNRALFREQLDAAIQRARGEGGSVGVLFLDLDHFKRINDTMGHSVGDRLLLAAADRLRSCVRLTDAVARGRNTDERTISRLGGDEFTVLVPAVKKPEDLAKVARRIQNALVEPFELDGRQVLVSASIGITVWPLDGADSEQLLRNADVAMYHAKERGRNEFQFYASSLGETAMRRIELEGRLRDAAARGELELHLQPRVAAATGKLVGFEALLRWRDPERGLILPGDFIAVAEDTGLIVPIGDWVIQHACETVRRWDDAGLPAATLSVNVSARQLRGEPLAERLLAHAQAAGIDPRRIEVEITESTLIGGTRNVLETLQALRALGVRIAIDDFGTGYSCLGYLRTLPVDTLKVDRVFVSRITESETDRALTAAIVAMGRALGLHVVAEGVETAGQAYLLSSWGCDELQGYLMSRPIPEAEVEAYWRAQLALAP